MRGEMCPEGREDESQPCWDVCAAGAEETWDVGFCVCCTEFVLELRESSRGR